MILESRWAAFARSVIFREPSTARKSFVFQVSHPAQRSNNAWTECRRRHRANILRKTEVLPRGVKVSRSETARPFSKAECICIFTVASANCSISNPSIISALGNWPLGGEIDRRQMVTPHQRVAHAGLRRVWHASFAQRHEVTVDRLFGGCASRSCASSAATITSIRIRGVMLSWKAPTGQRLYTFAAVHNLAAPSCSRWRPWIACRQRAQAQPRHTQRGEF